MTGGSAYQDRLGQAADWLVRLQAEDVAEADALAFDGWLEADPRNAAAYDAALMTSREVEINAQAIRLELRARSRPATPLRRGVLTAGALAAAALVAAVFVPAMLPAATTAYATGPGEQRTITLADGTRIDLNGSSHMSVTLGHNARQVKMDEGQALFDVTHDPRRPFLIAAGDRTVRVVGTQFDVRHRAGQLSVTVTRGAVEVTPAATGQGQAFRLHPGQRLEHREGAATARVVAAAPEQALGWRSGRLVYRDQPLSVVVADLNARFDRPIRVDDPALAETPISGVFIVDSEDAVVRRLALLVSAHAVPSGASVALQRDEAPKR